MPRLKRSRLVFCHQWLYVDLSAGIRQKQEKRKKILQWKISKIFLLLWPFLYPFPRSLNETIILLVFCAVIRCWAGYIRQTIRFVSSMPLCVVFYIWVDTDCEDMKVWVESHLCWKEQEFVLCSVTWSFYFAP